MGRVVHRPLFLALCFLLALGAIAAPVSADILWISPSSYEDPGSNWDSEEKVYDDNETGTRAKTVPNVPPLSWNDFLILNVDTVLCSAVRFYAISVPGAIDQIDVDAYYEGRWNDVYQGTYAHEAWVEKPLNGTYRVTAMRIRMYNSHASSSRASYLYEVDFYGQLYTPTYAIGEVVAASVLLAAAVSMLTLVIVAPSLLSIVVGLCIVILASVAAAISAGVLEMF